MNDSPGSGGVASLRGARLARLRPEDYFIDPAVIDRVMTPALAIFVPGVRRNIRRMVDYLGGVPDRWRPHLKTTKTPAIYAELVDAGLRAFKCATLREARCLLEVARERGVDTVDLLVAYPVQGPGLGVAGRLAAEFAGARIAVLSEAPDHVAQIPQPLGVFVDVNPQMNRTGIPLADRDAIAAVAVAAGDRFRGLHFYDGHIHSGGADERRRAAHALYGSLVGIVEALGGHGIACGEVVTSGTPTFRYALDYSPFEGGRIHAGPCLHRVSPGTVVFHDFQYDELLEDVELEPAALVLTRVVSHPAGAIATCDAGSKSIAAEAGDPVAFVVGRPDLVADHPSEEHLPLRLAADSNEGKPARGTLLMLVPRHVCPTVNLAEQALLVDADGGASVVDVAARARDLLAE